MNALMKISFALFLALFLNNSAVLAEITPNYQEGDLLQVSAKSGLKVREQPSLNAKVFGVIQFGAEVTILNTLAFDRAQTIENVEGSWVYVESFGLKGFVFDGFLSRLPVSKKAYSIDQFLEDQYVVATITDTTLTDFGMPQKVTVYDTGHELRTCNGEGYELTEVLLKNTRMSEALGLYLNSVSDKQHFLQNLKIKRDSDKNVIEYFGANESEEITISKSENGISIKVLYAAGC